MKRIIVIINLIFLTCVSFLNAQPKPKLYINFSKNTYLTGEYEQVEVGVINVNHYIFTEGWEKLVLELIDENGKNFEYKGISGGVFLEWKGQKLNPGEKAYNILLLNDSFGKSWHSFATVDLYLDPGKYTLRGTLYLPDGDTSKSEASFQVIEPSGEELSVYHSFVNIITEFQKTKNDFDLTNRLQSVLDAHPQTVYAPLILDILNASYDFGLNQHDKAFSVRKKLVENYSWSVRGRPMIDDVLQKIQSDSERIKYLEKIHVNSKGTMMEKVYEKKIKAVKEKAVK